MSIHKKAVRANLSKRREDDCLPQSWTPLSSSLPSSSVDVATTAASPFGAGCRDTVRVGHGGGGGGGGGLGAAALAASSHALFAAGMSIEAGDDDEDEEVQRNNVNQLASEQSSPTRHPTHSGSYSSSYRL